VRQLEKVSGELLAELARRAQLLPGAAQLAFVDVDSTQRRVYGHAKLGRGVRLHQDPGQDGAGPRAERARGHDLHPGRGAGDRTGQTARRQRVLGPGRGQPHRRSRRRSLGRRVRRDHHRADGSAYYSAAACHAARWAGACFSVTARLDPAVRAAIAAIPDVGWSPIKYPRAIWDEQAGRWASDADVAEVKYRAFASVKGKAITARLIVRRVRDLNPEAAQGTGELFAVWRHHAVFTDSPFIMLQAEEQHRDRAVIEQVFADLTSGPLAHAPSGTFAANAAWLALAAIAHNLIRAAGVLASARHARARGATIRADLVHVAARIDRHGRGHLTLHLPAGWHRQDEWTNLFNAGCGPPARAA
jgi:hypothetical protein